MMKKMKYLIKEEKGITLVALVVTIVVLIILAGISINLAMGENGIISKTKQAKEMQEMSDVHDKLELIRGKVALDNETIVTWDKYKAELIKENIITGDNDVEDIENGKKQIVTDTGYVAVIEITPDGTVGKIEIIGKADSLKVNIINVAVTSGTNSIKVDVTARRTDNATFEYYYKTEGGEYQTSPVHEGTDLSYAITNLAQNTTYTIKVEATNKNGTVEKEAVAVTIKAPTIADKRGGSILSTTDNTKILDDNGNTVTVPAGFKIASDSATVVNAGIVIEDARGNQFVWVPVSDTSKMYTTGTATLTSTTVTTPYYSLLRVRSADTNSYKATTPGNANGIREPDLITRDTDSQYYNTILGYTDVATMANGFVADYMTMINSTNIYKGFYIGRYELTGSVDSPTEKVGRPLVSQNWHNLYKACKNVVTGNAHAETRMVWGCQWDETMSWLVTSGAKTDAEVNQDSTSWGNYANNAVLANDGITTLKASGVLSLLDTGATAYTKANNIYDLAGNCCEWTQEAYGLLATRITRGAYYSYAGPNSPASMRLDYSTDGGNNCSARTSLYIK